MDNRSHSPDAPSNAAPDASNTSEAGEANHPATATTSAAPSRDEEYSLPCAEAVLAGMLALMTGHAQACCTSQRDDMGRKIVASLHQLAHSDQFTPHFRALLCSLQRRWVQQCSAERAAVLPQPAALTAAEKRRALWVAAPTALQ